MSKGRYNISLQLTRRESKPLTPFSKQSSLEKRWRRALWGVSQKLPSRKAGATYRTSKLPSTRLHLLYLLRTCLHFCLISLWFYFKEICLQPWKPSLLWVSQFVCGSGFSLVFISIYFLLLRVCLHAPVSPEEHPDCEFLRTRGFRFIFSKVTQWMAFCQELTANFIAAKN